MNIYIKLIYISIFFIQLSVVKAQVFLTNPSMEDFPADATMPPGWMSASSGSTPDILPGYWGVYGEPEDGDTYLGLITRHDGSYESLQQRLENKLKKDECYSMGIYLAHSDGYSGYNKSIKLRIWISDKKGKRQQMIFESPLITDEEWTFYPIDFRPTKTMKYMILEAYNDNGQKDHKANILIDAIRDPKSCNKV